MTREGEGRVGERQASRKVVLENHLLKPGAEESKVFKLEATAINTGKPAMLPFHRPPPTSKTENLNMPRK